MSSMGLFKAYIRPSAPEVRELGRISTPTQKPLSQTPESAAHSKVSSSFEGLTSTSVQDSPYHKPVLPTTGYQISSNAIHELKADVMVAWLHQRQLEKLWTKNGIGEGIILKKSKDDYTCCPSDLKSEPEGIYEAVKLLNVKVCDGDRVFDLQELTSSRLR